MSGYPDPYRWVSLEEAARRLGIRLDNARPLLRARGLVRDLDGRERVWLDDLRSLGQAETTVALPARPPRADGGLKPIPKRKSI